MEITATRLKYYSTSSIVNILKLATYFWKCIFLHRNLNLLQIVCRKWEMNVYTQIFYMKLGFKTDFTYNVYARFHVLNKLF